MIVYMYCVYVCVSVCVGGGGGECDEIVHRREDRRDPYTWHYIAHVYTDR